MKRYDLHVHTTASDGVKTPEEVILMACQAGLSGLSITDHDNVDGLERAQQFIMARQLTLELIPGVELNTDGGDDEVHILGYFIDFRHPYVQARLLDIKRERDQRAEKIIHKLKSEMNINIKLEIL
jgi:predicted metal-dependent phosphoesterase TrpH